MRKFLWSLVLIFMIPMIMLSVNYPSEAGNGLIRLKVLGQTEFLSGSSASLRIITLDEVTQKPLGGINISVKLILNKKEVNLFSGLTDNTGSFEGNFTIPSHMEGPAKLEIKAFSETDKKELSADITIKNGFKILLTTDKPLYQPSQTINLRILALDKATMVPLTGKSVTFEIQDGKGNKVFKSTQKLSDFGVASSEFHLADEVNMGEYHIKAAVDKEVTEKTVSVKRYVLPKFNNIVKTDREYYLPGQTLKGSLQSCYFFGKPVFDGEVKIIFSTFYVKETKLFELNGKTDKEGFFSFEYKLPDYFTGLPLEGGKAKLEMEITVTDSAKHQEITYKSLPVVKEGMQITVVPESAQLLPGIENTVYVLTGYPDGSPASTTLDVKLKDKTEKIKTDNTGFAEFKIKPSEVRTDYEINCYDEKGNSAAAKGVFQTGQADSLLLRTDKALYRTGEPVKVNVFYPNQAGTAYVDIIRDGQTLLTKSVEIKNGKASLEWILAPDCAGSLALHILAIIANAIASYDQSDKILDKIFEKLMEMKKENKETLCWESRLESVTFSNGISSTVETTALVTYAMLKSDRYLDVANKCISFLIQNKDPYGTWHSTQPTILALRALLLAEEKSSEEVNVAGSVLINGKKIRDFNIDPTNFDLYQQFDLSNYTGEGKNRVEIKFEGKGPCLYQIVTEYYLPWSMIEEVKKKEPISIEVLYEDTKLHQNDIVTSRANVINNTDGDIKMTMVDLGVPPGFTVETDELQKLVEDKIIQKYSLTGRQIIIYLENISAGKSLELSYRLRAKYPLKVQVPPSQVYEYYNPENITETKPFEMVVE